MIAINVCIGSACHLKGSYNVISELQHLIEVNHLSDKIEIKAVFCMGRCSEAVAVRVNNEEIESLNSDMVSAFFKHRIIPLIS